MSWEQQYALIFGGIFLASLAFYLFASSRAKRVPKIVNEIIMLDCTHQETQKRAKTPYETYPSPVRFFGVNDKLPPSPTFDLNQPSQRNCFVKLILVNQGWVIKQEEKPKRKTLKLPRNKALKLQQVESSELNASEAQTLTLLEQCNEESFNVELQHIETLPSVSNDIPPELREMMLLAECEEEE